jgi:hypothetical protein
LVAAVLDEANHTWRERVAACGALGSAALGAGARDVASEALGETLSRGPGVARRPLLRRSAVLAAAVALPVASALFTDTVLARGWFFARSAVDWVAGAAVVTGAFGVAVAAVLWPVMAALLALRARALGIRVRASAADALGDLGLPAAVGPVAGALFDLSPSVRRAAWAALPRAVGALDPSHYGQVDGVAVAALGRALGRNGEALDLALLEALGKVGGASAVGPVERLAKFSRSDAVRHLALAILPQLHDRRRKETDALRLLRPARPGDNPGVLLRPATATPAQDPGTLVRPADP